jgi:DNA-binding MarR family transcriptional regulator
MMDSNNDLKRLAQALQKARVLFNNPDLQVPMLIVFLAIGVQRSMPMTQLPVTVGLSQSAVSRIVAKLGRGMVGEDGLGFVDAFEDPEWRRRKLVRLTRKGEKALLTLKQILGGAAKPLLDATEEQG